LRGRQNPLRLLFLNKNTEQEMSDNLKRYRAICEGLKRFFPKQLTPRQWQHFRVMAAMINGIVGPRSSAENSG